MIPHAGFKLQICWICRSGIYTSHRDDGEGIGRWIQCPYDGPFDLNALIIRSKKESESLATSLVQVRFTWVWVSQKLQSNHSYQSGIPSAEFDMSSAVIGRGRWWRFVCCWLINSTFPPILCSNAQFQVQPEEFWLKSGTPVINTHCIAWNTGFCFQ